VRIAASYGVVALIALAFTLVPGGGATLEVIGMLLQLAFLTVIAVLGYRSYRRYRFELSSLSDHQRLVLYGSIGAAVLCFCAAGRMLTTGAGVVAWLALLGLCSFGVYWVWTQYRSYG
jgi:uncharacterized membrane protein YebE (DUF533 family)